MMYIVARLNFEIPDEVEECLKEESREHNVPKKMIVIETLRERYREQGRIE